jgi:hypothetical protein
MARVIGASCFFSSAVAGLGIAALVKLLPCWQAAACAEGHNNRKSTGFLFCTFFLGLSNLIVILRGPLYYARTILYGSY